MEGLSDLSYADRMSIFNLFFVRGRLLRADLVQVWKILSSESHVLTSLFNPALYSGTRGHRFKRFVSQADTGNHSCFFSVCIVELWNSLPDDGVSSVSLSVFKRRVVSVFF